MRILLTGGNGFVGSHVLDALLHAGHRATLLLRTTSDTTFIRQCLDHVRVVYGSIEPASALAEAVREAEAVVHCAGKTKALRREEFYAVNGRGTANLVTACNEHAASLRQFVLISSLAVSGPGTPQNPACEDAEPAPVTDYGRSKLQGEMAVRENCRSPFTILRPAAVYGPRDSDFFLLFKAVQRGIVPLPVGGKQPLSLIYGPDVGRAVVSAVGRREAFGGTFHLAHRRPLSQCSLVDVIAGAAGQSPLRLPVPRLLMYPVLFAGGLAARVRGQVSIVNLQKLPEYTAEGWVCCTQAARQVLGFDAPTPVGAGVEETLTWYRRQGWLEGRQ